MENKELMVTENEVMDIDTVECEDSGISTGAAMAIGAGLTFLIGIGVKYAKKAIAHWKNSKNQPDKVKEDGAEEEEAVNDVPEN